MALSLNLKTYLPATLNFTQTKSIKSLAGEFTLVVFPVKTANDVKKALKSHLSPYQLKKITTDNLLPQFLHGSTFAFLNFEVPGYSATFVFNINYLYLDNRPQYYIL